MNHLSAVSVALFGLLTLLGSGCASQSSTDTSAPATAAIPSAQARPDNPPTPTSTPARSVAAAPSKSLTTSPARFSQESLYELLVAELAAHRGQPQLTLATYLDQAKQTRDLGITQRALMVARHMKDANALLDAALLWSELEPENPQPLQIAIVSLLSLQQYERAMPLLKKVLLMDDTTTLEHIADQADKLPAELRQQLTALFREVMVQRPGNATLHITQGLLLKQEQHHEEALREAQEALALSPGQPRAILLEAELQHTLGHTDTAIGHLREALAERDHKQMRLLYTRLLMEQNQPQQAHQQADLLLSNHPDDNYLVYYLGVLMLEHNQLERSQALFNQLLNNVSSSTPHYYLGRIALQQGATDTAVEHFLQVSDGPTLLAAYNQLTQLFTDQAEQPRLQQIFADARLAHREHSAALFSLEAGWLLEQELTQPAMQLFDAALQQHPEDVRLRYARAMLGEQLGDLALLEADLRYILQLEPQNAMALNALGYTLTDRTDRHEEALVLIEQALALKPDDPAILDSMGWVHYHLGNPTLALEYLERAYRSFPDPEIASHLGTVYWQQGDTQRAMKIWREALERDPESPVLLEAIRQAQGDT